MKNKAQKKTEFSLHIPPQMWQEFQQAMLNSRSKNEEVIGFFFAQRQQINKHKTRYIPKSWVVPSADCYEHQSPTGLELKQQFHQYLLKNQLGNKKLDVIHIHTHVGDNLPSFSSIDDHYESEYAQFLAKNFKYKPRLVSGVFNSNLQQSKFRIWNRQGNSFSPVKFSNSWFELPPSTNSLNEQELMFTRQKIFGDTVQKQLSQLQVTLIGCGGIGSIFAETLGRLGVKKWTLIDPDFLETVNLNRMVAATPLMVEQKWRKVDYIKYLIKRIYPTGSHVKTIPHLMESAITKPEILNSDLIVVATDNHRSRQLAQELALEYMRPLICLGTHIDVKPDNNPRMYCRVTIPPLGGGWCLMCANIINLQRAALEIAPSEIHQLADEAGYLKGIGDPAVLWLNSICASTAVGIIHGMISGFLNIDDGLDWIYDFSNSNWLKTNPQSLTNSDCYFCSKDEHSWEDNSVFNGQEISEDLSFDEYNSLLSDHETAPDFLTTHNDSSPSPNQDYYISYQK